jgi:hypothetical protein
VAGVQRFWIIWIHFVDQRLFSWGYRVDLRSAFRRNLSTPMSDLQVAKGMRFLLFPVCRVEEATTVVQGQADVLRIEAAD